MEFPLQSPSIGFTILIFLIVITVLVFVHEMGHFLVARFFKVKVDAFSIGFGREIVGWTDKKGTRWKIAPFPLGGYVKFAGDANVTSTPGEKPKGLTPEEEAALFQNKPVYQRALITAAGPFVNFLFAAVVFSALYSTIGQPYVEPLVTAVVEGSRADEAGFEPGDRLTAINGRIVETFGDVQNYVAIRPGADLVVTVFREGRSLDLSVTPKLVLERDRFGNEYEKGQLGLHGGSAMLIKRGPFEAVYYGSVATVERMDSMLDGLWQIISGRISVDQLSGPLRIAKLSGEVASIGLVSLIQFMAFISISLGLVNLFPIPMLDGGHLVFYAYEAIRRRPASLRLQEAAMYAGVFVVVGFSLFVAWNDLKALKVWEGLSKLVS